MSARTAIPTRLVRRLVATDDEDLVLHDGLDMPISDVPGAGVGNRGAERHADARGAVAGVQGHPGPAGSGRFALAPVAGIPDGELHGPEVTP